jgi:heme A synthase
MEINTKFAKYAWMVLVANIGVILWGAYVRATGSGAGCGSHWPLCNGEVIPRAAAVETLIELTHRVTSGIALLLVLGMLIWAFRAYPKGSLVRQGAAYSMLFMGTEALVGAGLVLFEWVAGDESTGRVVSMAVHLINTFLLLGSLTLTAWWASGGRALRLSGQGILLWLIGFAFLGVLLIGVTGAMTALGDTLFRAGSFQEGLQQDLDSRSHFLIRLRVWHPVIAILVGFFLGFLSGLLALLRDEKGIKRFAGLLIILILVQLGAGLVNVLLNVPVAMQIIHLLLADLIWITLVLFSASLFGDPEYYASQASVPQTATSTASQRI